MGNRYRTILKKFYVTESENEGLNQLIKDTDLRTFSNFARTMLFKESTLLIRFDESYFDDLLLSLRRIENNLGQLVRIAEQSQDSNSYRAMTYSLKLVSDYEKLFIKIHKRKKQKLLTKGG